MTLHIPGLQIHGYFCHFDMVRNESVEVAKLTLAQHLPAVSSNWSCNRSFTRQLSQLLSRSRSQCHISYTAVLFYGILESYRNIALYFLNRLYVTTWERVFDRCHGNCRRQHRLSLPPTSLLTSCHVATSPHPKRWSTQNIPFIQCISPGMLGFLFWGGGCKRKHRILETLRQ